MKSTPFFGATVFAASALTILVLTVGPVSADGDPAAGEKTFKKCKACHVVDSDKNRVGPSLRGVVGRTAGSVGGYKYSKAMLAFGEGGAVWDDPTLNAWLTKPKDLVKGTKMSFPGLKKPEDRANVIAYLKQFPAE
jgi:cytochrome c